MADHELTSQLYYDSVWNDADVYARDGVTITRGRGDETAGEPTPSSSASTLSNRTVIHNPRNPASTLFGKISQNTPMRHYLGTVSVIGDANFSANSGLTSHVAPSLDAPAAGLLICSWAAPNPDATYTAPAGMTSVGPGDSDSFAMRTGQQIIASSGATGTRTATIDPADEFMAVSVFITGPAELSGSLLLTGNSYFINVSDPGDLIVLISAFASTSTIEKPTVPAYPSDTDGGGWVVAADTGDVFLGDADAQWGRMKAWAKKGRTKNSAHHITLPGSDDDRTQSWITVIPASDVGGSWDIRHVGEVGSWRPDRTPDFDPDTGKGDSWTSVTADGLLRRLAQGSPPAVSPMRRDALATAQGPSGPIAAAYWPLEDGPLSTLAASGLPTGSPMRFIGTYTFAGSDIFPGSAPLVLLGEDSAFFGDVGGEVDTTGNLFVRITVHIPTDHNITDGVNLINAYVNGSAATRFSIQYNTGGSLKLAAVDESDNTTLAASNSLIFTVDGFRVNISMELVQDGDDIDWLVAVQKLSEDGLTVNTTLNTGTFTDLDVGRCVRITGGALGNFAGCTVGHIGVGNSQAFMFGLVDALKGYAAETAGDRFLRLCKENNLPGSMLGDPDDTAPMGAQPIDTLTNILAEIERTDGGIIYEPRDQLGIVYRTPRSLYNQTAKLSLDWDKGQVAQPLTPVVDDLPIRNDVTARRRDGSTFRAAQTSGPLNISKPEDDPQGVGRYDTEIDVNPATDSVLRHIAGWYLHLGTVDEARWPQVTVDLDKNPTLADDASAVDIGDLIEITNTPADVSPDDIRLIVIGYTEAIAPRRRTITFNCRPASPYNVGVLDDDVYSYLGSDGSTVATAFTSGTDTSLSVAVASGYPLWDDADAPFDIMADGVRLTVTAISGTSSPQTFTVTQTPVNGVEKTIAVGKTVDIYPPIYIGL